MLTYLVDGLSFSTQTVSITATSAFPDGGSLHHDGRVVQGQLCIQEMKRKSRMA